MQGDFLDTYRNLSYKNIMGNLWVSQFCEQAQFVVKTDDDQYVDLYEVLVLTGRYSKSLEYAKNRFILCPVWRGLPILVGDLFILFMKYFFQRPERSLQQVVRVV